jgi:AcrR family transcriptional regulator
MTRHRPGQARRAIVTAAVTAFASRGYDATGLDEIGAAVGLSRPAVLYHFPTKLELLAAAVEPYFADLDQVLAGIPADRPLPARGRRALITRLVETLYANRGVAELLARDITTRTKLDIERRLQTFNQRFIDLLVGADADAADRIRGLAVLGALTRPLTGPLDPGCPEQRRALIDAASAASHPPRRSRAAASRSPAELHPQPGS